MPLGTLDRTAPPLFNQGPSALSRLILCGALALVLMVADARFHVVQPLRSAVGAVLYPLQWLALKPVQLVQGGGRYLEDLGHAQRAEDQARRELAQQAERASRADALAEDNARLRALLDLRQATQTPGRAAEVLYDAADPYTRKVVIDQGLTAGIAPGSPVIDERGVLGQVTSVQPLVSEVTLVIDRDQAIPVQNVRTGARSIAFGDAAAYGDGMELRFIDANADVQQGDLLTTSGVDGVYPAGLPVATIDRIDRRADSSFARIHCRPLARVTAARYVMVLAPVDRAERTPTAAPASGASAPGRKPDARTAARDARTARDAKKAEAAEPSPSSKSEAPRRNRGNKP